MLLWPIPPFLAVGSTRGGCFGCGFFNFMARIHENRKAILEFNVRSAGLRAQLNFYADSYTGR
mgnify:CR=1 FL=1